jgi:hypothetical protein
MTETTAGLTLHGTDKPINSLEEIWEKEIESREHSYHLSRKIETTCKAIRNAVIIGSLVEVIAIQEISSRLPFETNTTTAYDKSIVGALFLAGAMHVGRWSSRLAGDIQAQSARESAKSLSAPPPLWAAESRRRGEMYDEDRRP